MTVTATWTSPAAAGALDLATGSIINETWVDAMVSNFLYLAGPTGIFANRHATTFIVDSGGIQVTLGNIGIGAVPSTAAGLVVASANTGASQYGIILQPQGNTTASTAMWGVYSQPGVTGSFTCPIAASFYAIAPSKAGGALIATSYGLLVDPINTGSTNNYGVYIGASSGGSTVNLGLYNAGTTQLVGATSITGILTLNNAASLVTTGVVLTNYAAGNTGTLGNGPISGNPSKWFAISDNGTFRYVPAW